MSEAEREAITQDYLKPNCPALEVPRLDEEVRQQLKQKGKDPQFGIERTMFKLQEQILEVAGLLTCLWVYLLNSVEEPDIEQLKLVIQGALVFWGMHHTPYCWKDTRLLGLESTLNSNL